MCLGYQAQYASRVADRKEFLKILIRCSTAVAALPSLLRICIGTQLAGLIYANTRTVLCRIIHISKILIYISYDSTISIRQFILWATNMRSLRMFAQCAAQAIGNGPLRVAICEAAVLQQYNFPELRAEFQVKVIEFNRIPGTSGRASGQRNRGYPTIVNLKS